MNPIFIGNKRGVAILITLTIIALLIMTTLELNRQARSAVLSTATTRDRITLSQMTISAVNLAMALLIKDKKESETDSIQENWADAEKIKEVLDSVTFEEGDLSLKISDEIGRIQVNALVQYPNVQDFNQPQRLLLDRCLRLALASTETSEDIDPANTIVNALKDWLDSGDDNAITGLSGAESEYYQDLDPPYNCKNGPIEHISELLLVKGVTPELFYGTEETAALRSSLTENGMSDEAENTLDYKGKINISTADLPVLAALLPEENQELAQALYDYRIEKTGSVYTRDLSSDTWYKNVPGAGDIEIDPELITTKSNLFRIEVAAILRDMKMNVTAVVKRGTEAESGKYICKVLSWEQK